MYHYEIHEFGNLSKIGKYLIPYTANFPRLVYNYQLSELEVVGDYFASSYDSTTNSYHFSMSDTGVFNKISNSLWSPVQYGSLVYVGSVGTLCIGGYANSKKIYSAQIVTQNSDWPTVSSNNHTLSSYDSTTGYGYLGVTTNEDVIFLVGGYDYSSTKNIQSLDLSDVSDLRDAQSRSWNTLGSLTYAISSATVQFVSDQLFVIGYGSGKHLQVFDLQINQNTPYHDVYSTPGHYGVAYAGSWISNGNMTIFGGRESQDCFQQSGYIDNPGIFWGDSCDNSVIEGTVINGSGWQVNSAIILN